ncbi:MAG: RNA-binding protein [Desulfobacter sp.]|jgi:RNA recognition motif-containing protein|uniref:RNA recognition motif domain-containing protein n=1 Tax=uncultured Desulfobacter sp. TaxID=240139 RepID=UPI0029C99D0E|nr:RNA-binding protein [uncultured Desulfobacter sp.]MCW8800537.1 RNA-binding protein [Desulfobacter sp.]
MKIYVGNLTELMTEETLKQAFDAFGEVESVKIIKNRFNGRSKGFGFVEMPSNSEADKAIKALNGNIVDKKPIKVNHADSGGKKKKKPFRRRSY